MIPSIRVDAPLIRLGLDAKGALEVPKRFDEAGWWTGGARPGEPGPAVIAGHVDSKTGAAVFYEIRRAAQGRRGLRAPSRRQRARFVVQGSASYPKDRFPTARVYGPTRRPTLRLITCSGEFDRSTRSLPRQHRRLRHGLMRAAVLVAALPLLAPDARARRPASGDAGAAQRRAGAARRAGPAA